MKRKRLVRSKACSITQRAALWRGTFVIRVAPAHTRAMTNPLVQSKSRKESKTHWIVCFILLAVDLISVVENHFSLLHHLKFTRMREMQFQLHLVGDREWMCWKKHFSLNWEKKGAIFIKHQWWLLETASGGSDEWSVKIGSPSAAAALVEASSNAVDAVVAPSDKCYPWWVIQLKTHCHWHRKKRAQGEWNKRGAFFHPIQTQECMSNGRVACQTVGQSSE